MTAQSLFQQKDSEIIVREPSFEFLGMDWAANEFGRVDFGDGRLNKRVIKIASAFGQQPTASIPKACGGWAAAKAAYNFFDHKKVSVSIMLDSHLDATIDRIKGHKVVLVPQDTTSLNHTTHPDTEGLGTIGGSRSSTLGIMVHDTMAFSVDGLALGLVDLQTWTRPKEASSEVDSKAKAQNDKDKKKKSADQKPIWEKESYRWLKSYEATKVLQQKVPGTMLVNMGDRESDIYELFELTTQDKNGPELLVRASHDRLVDHSEAYLWKFMGTRKVKGSCVIEVPRKKGQPKREATLEIRYSRVTLKRPKNISTPNMPKSITLWAVLAQESNPPAGIEPISWLLLTTIAVHNFQEAMQKVEWYVVRWQIELFHKVLKSGCRAEDRQLKTVEKLERCLAVDAVVAWRILLLTKLGREVPDLACSVVFEEYEWKALYSFIHQTTQLPDKEPTLQEAIRMTAKLGGFLGRKNDGEPGSMTLWRGLQRLNDITEAWRIFSEGSRVQN